MISVRAHLDSIKYRGFPIVTIAMVLLMITIGTTDASGILSPLNVRPTADDDQISISVMMDAAGFQSIHDAGERVSWQFPLPRNEEVILDMERFNVLADNARFVVGGPDGGEPMEIPEVVLYRGGILDDPGSHAFLAFTRQGSANGFVVRGDGRRYYLFHTASQIRSNDWGRFTVTTEMPIGSTIHDEDIPLCVTDDRSVPVPPAAESESAADVLVAGHRMVYVAIDADEAYVHDVFGNNLEAAAAYVIQLIALCSDIYQRDLHMKFLVSQVRLWPGGCPMSADSLEGMAHYWETLDDTTGFNLMELFSGRRDLWYYGRAVVTGGCRGQGAFGIQGYMNGSFYLPYDVPNIGNGDIFSVVHEWGHNFGAPHSHDPLAFYPPIDSCGDGFYTRGTIMSYCHLFPGEKANIDFYFHSRMRDRLRQVFEQYDCFEYDCNGNNIADSADITQGVSFDVNGNGVPDECEDCDGNGTLDDVDIAGGAADINENGVPDVCEPDCNGNGLPDEYDVRFSSEDRNGNTIPDECEPDCDLNGVSDLVEVRENTTDDFDRNAVPDVCQDCNENGVTDWIDLGRQHNIFISDVNEGVIREFIWASGVQVGTIAHPLMENPIQITFGTDRQLYVAEIGSHSVLKVNVDNHQVEYFVPSGSGGLAFPSDLVFAPNGNLLVSSYLTGNIKEYDYRNGQYLGDFVDSGSGGLASPIDLAFGPDGNLFVATADNRILKYSGADGSFIEEFVGSQGGELQFGQGLVFKPDGNLVVASIDNNRVLEYDGANGDFVRLFPGVRGFTMVRNITLAPNGNVLILDAGRTLHLQEYEYESDGGGRIFVNRIRLPEYTTFDGAWGLAIRPAAPNDCNGNGVLDICDIAAGLLSDTDSDGYPDECENIDTDMDGIYDFNDNCVVNDNPSQEDLDGDGVGDVCDRCSGYADSADYDHDLVPDGCDNCTQNYNPFQSDVDGDLIGDACDNCIHVPGADQTDGDRDGFGDLCDICPGFDDDLDADGDLVPDGCDLCDGYDDNFDADSDLVPDGCDRCEGYDDRFDSDGDLVPDGCDICPGFNDNDDGDGDNVPDSCDNCPATANSDQADSDHDGLGDSCDIQCGDANRDGTANVGDAVFLIGYVFKGGAAPTPVCVGDANGDGNTNVGDAVYMITYVFKGGAPPIVPCCP